MAQPTEADAREALLERISEWDESPRSREDPEHRQDVQELVDLYTDALMEWTALRLRLDR